jgi:alkylation response protein AidB-like acyl-CoA dehydrogenase
MRLNEDQKLLLDEVRRLGRERIAPRALEVANTHDYPWHYWEALKSLDLLGIYYPEEWGGGGAGLTTLALVVEQLAYFSNTASSMAIGQVFAGIPLIELGTQEQKEKYLRRLAGGEVLTAMAMTEPSGGSDAAAIESRAVRDGDDYILNGEKCFCSNANIAEVVLVYAKTDPAKGAKGITGFLVDRGTPGFEITRLEDKMGATALPTCALAFRDLRIPAGNRLGPENEGFGIAMRAFGKVRPIIGARAVGLAQGALDATVAHARERKTFGKPLGGHQSIAFLIADMSTEIEAARNLVYRACEAVEAEEPDYERYCAMAKLFATDVAMRVTTDCVQIFGGYGYMKDYPVEHRMREAKVGQIVEGANQIQRIVISRSILGRL